MPAEGQDRILFIVLFWSKSPSGDSEKSPTLPHWITAPSPAPDQTRSRTQVPTHLGDVHDLDGRQLSRLDMSTLQQETEGGKGRDENKVTLKFWILSEETQ